MKYVATHFSFTEETMRMERQLKSNPSPCKTIIKLRCVAFGINACSEQQCILSEGFKERNTSKVLLYSEENKVINKTLNHYGNKDSSP